MSDKLCADIPQKGKDGQDIPRPRTSEFYRTCNLPPKFEHPTWFYGYGVHREPPQNPCYRTCSSDYGRYPPSVHTIPTAYFPRGQVFSNALARHGMYRNYSLNTAMDNIFTDTYD